jgi:hypothetical protein
MKNFVKVLLFAALFAANFAKPLCLNSCESNDETQNRIKELTLQLDAEGLKSMVEFLDTFNPPESNTTNLRIAPLLGAALEGVGSGLAIEYLKNPIRDGTYSSKKRYTEGKEKITQETHDMVVEGKLLNKID